MVNVKYIPFIVCPLVSVKLFLHEGEWMRTPRDGAFWSGEHFRTPQALSLGLLACMRSQRRPSPVWAGSGQSPVLWAPSTQGSRARIPGTARPAGSDTPDAVAWASSPALQIAPTASTGQWLRRKLPAAGRAGRAGRASCRSRTRGPEGREAGFGTELKSQTRLKGSLLIQLGARFHGRAEIAVRPKQFVILF